MRTLKHGVGVDGKAASSGKKQNVVKQSSGATAAVTSSKLEDIPENTSVCGSIRESTLFLKQAPSPGKSMGDVVSAPAPGETQMLTRSMG